MNKPGFQRRLAAKAKELRRGIVRMTYRAGQAHIGAALSCVDIITLLYQDVLKVSSGNPKDSGRDRFILSKGHGCLALYTILADKGFFAKSKLSGFCQPGSLLGGHPDMCKVPGVEASTGSLGHGLSVGLGMALAGKEDRRNYRVFVLLGDGECQEGVIWEAVMAATHFKADNLVVIVDNNGLQLLDSLKNTISSLEPIADKFRVFGWSVKEVDGHNLGELSEGLRRIPFEQGKPSCIVARTVKGKGVSFMENKPQWHYRGLTDEEYRLAMRELK